jgi:hypothetical protein
MEQEAEINQIKRELAILRCRYALYRRMARIVRAVFITLMLLSAIGALVSAVKLFLFDPLYGVFFVAALLILVLAFIWLIKFTELRWIDLAAPQWSGIYHPDFFKPDRRSHRGGRSEAELTEQQISDRERRLSELGENFADSSKAD